ncbi:DUF2971 domain-containing protein [Tunturiibacter psychrotolerans]|uniref:DUF2971 domain-containing protein n=1 Tax=Tunturiibacter psychrotolerans TaxID=3069686 RepID=UPI003D9B5E5B
MNDRKEYKIAAKLLKVEIEKTKLKSHERRLLLGLINQAQQASFILSFSERGDLLSQWRAYCSEGHGYSLGFSQHHAVFRSAKQHSFNLIRCEYDPTRQRKLCKQLIANFVERYFGSAEYRGSEDMADRIKAFFNRYQWQYTLALLSSSLKHKGFAEEEEWRLVSQYPDDLIPNLEYRVGRFGVTPYYSLPIIVGDEQKLIDNCNDSLKYGKQEPALKPGILVASRS